MPENDFSADLERYVENLPPFSHRGVGFLARGEYNSLNHLVRRDGMIFGGIVGALLGMLYDPRAATYAIPTRGGAEYPGNRDDRAP